MRVAQPPASKPALKIIVIDDDELDRYVIRRTFSALDQSVELIEVSNPRNAVAMIRAHRPRLALLDIQMPGMSGFDVLEALMDSAMDDEGEGRPTPVMMLSSSTRQDDVRRALDMGAREYRVKPSTLDDYKRLAQDVQATYLV